MTVLLETCLFPSSEIPDVQLQEVKQLLSRNTACSSFRRALSEAHVQFHDPVPPFSSACWQWQDDEQLDNKLL
uniref:Uncharacterized protein n=1 Tax=Arundo donax TaxID=35708 RepID=A0A0A9G8C2_ARUDO